MSFFLKKRLVSWIQQIQTFSDQLWYGPLIGGLALADNFVFIIPTDGILISSTMLSPRKWVSFALCVGLGATTGAIALATVIDLYGTDFIHSFMPGIKEMMFWKTTQNFFDSYGLWVVFVVSVTPLPQQAPIILAALAGSPLVEIGLATGVGRMIKYFIMAYVSSHMPKLIARFWGFKKELKELGIKKD